MLALWQQNQQPFIIPQSLQGPVAIASLLVSKRARLEDSRAVTAQASLHRYSAISNFAVTRFARAEGFQEQPVATATISRRG